jgi:predicted nucleic acid-binding protein
MVGRGSIVLDTGPLLLLAAGPPCADKHKATRAYGGAAYWALKGVVGKFEHIIVTPHSLAETWNLSGNDDPKNVVTQSIRRELIRLIEVAVETFDPAKSMLVDDHFMSLGISDIGLVYAAKAHQSPLVTSDRKLWSIAQQRDIAALHIKDILL